MSHNSIKLQEGAFVIADAHYSYKRPQLLQLIKEIHSQKLQTPQLILMGDIFDALFGGVAYTQTTNEEIVRLIDEISKKIEVIYLEGNHDFNLKNIFKSARVVPIKEQPIACVFEDKKVYLSHGDFDGGRGYEIYTSIIRNSGVLFCLKTIDNLIGHKILKKLDAYLEKKDDCNEFSNFSEYTKRRLEGKFKCDFFVEGHFHQNKTFKIDNFEYTNLAAFACNQRYFIVNSSKENRLLKEVKIS